MARGEIIIVIGVFVIAWAQMYLTGAALVGVGIVMLIVDHIEGGHA